MSALFPYARVLCIPRLLGVKNYSNNFFAMHALLVAYAEEAQVAFAKCFFASTDYWNRTRRHAHSGGGGDPEFRRFTIKLKLTIHVF